MMDWGYYLGVLCVLCIVYIIYTKVQESRGRFRGTGRAGSGEKPPRKQKK